MTIEIIYPNKDMPQGGGHNPRPRGTPNRKAWFYWDLMGEPNCYWCKEEFTHSRPPTRDHITPVSKRGTAYDGFVLAHGKCNSVRGNTEFQDYEEFVVQIVSQHRELVTGLKEAFPCSMCSNQHQVNIDMLTCPHAEENKFRIYNVLRDVKEFILAFTAKDYDPQATSELVTNIQTKLRKLRVLGH